jgi:outer membrane biosynthesis protein TonB
MRAGLTVSVIFHVVLIAWGIVTLPSLRTLDASQVESVPVDFIPVDKATDLDKGVKTAELSEKRVQDKPAEKVAETPPPPQPRPEPPPIPAPAPEPQAEPEPLPPEPAQEQAQPAPPPPAPTPDPTPPPPKVAEAPKEAPVPKPRPHRPAPRLAQAQVKQTSDAAPDEMAALIDKSEPTGSTNINDEPATAGGNISNPDAKMTADEMAALRERMKSCWNPPQGATSHLELRTVVRVELNEDGSLAGVPQVLEAPGGTYSQSAPESVVRAIRRCEPYSLPADKYDAWREIEITFDPVDLFPG